MDCRQIYSKARNLTYFRRLNARLKLLLLPVRTTHYEASKNQPALPGSYQHLISKLIANRS